MLKIIKYEQESIFINSRCNDTDVLCLYRGAVCVRR